MRSAQAQLMALLDSQQLVQSNACAVLCGQDAEVRALVGVAVLEKQGADTLVLSGGLDAPPAVLSAEKTLGAALGAGIGPSKIVLESNSANTRQQAENVIALAEVGEWAVVALIASPYHIYRACLAFVRVLNERGLADKIRVVPIAPLLFHVLHPGPDRDIAWAGRPVGMGKPRIELLTDDLAKCGEHAAHVATWAEGIEYLQREWPEPKRVPPIAQGDGITDDTAALKAGGKIHAFTAKATARAKPKAGQ